MKAIPKISKYMTTTPFSISSEATVTEAMDMMQEKGIRHLPVLKDGKIFGLLSDRDLRSVYAFVGIDPKAFKVNSICVENLYSTTPDAFLNEVADEMAEKKFGSAVVMDNGHLVGIFTATDACRALSEICQTRFHN